MREYEFTFVVQPEITDDGLQALHAKFDGILDRHEAIKLYYDDWGRRRLAYEIQKFQKGHYFVLYFLDEGKVIPELERTARLEDSVLRFLTVQASDQVDDVEGRKVEAAALEEDRKKKAAERAAREAEEAAERATREAEEAAQRAAREAEQAAQRAAREAEAATAAAAAPAAAPIEEADPQSDGGEEPAAADAGATGDDEPTTAGAEATHPVASDDAEEPAAAESEAKDAVASAGDEEEKKPA